MDEEIQLELPLFSEELDIEEITERFMKSNADDKALSDDDEDQEPLETDEDPEDQDEDESEDDADDPDEDPEDDTEVEDDEDEDDDKSEPKKVADEDAEVTVSVDGKEHRVSVKELKRLYGQEASLTQKSQLLSAQRRAVEEQGSYVASLLQKRYEAAQAEAKKYAGVDLFKASRELDADEFDALRAAKEAAESEVQALEREGAEFLQRTQNHRMQVLKAQAQESLKVLTDPEKGIPNWSDELYSEIRTFAVSQGMDQTTVNEIVDPAAIKILHMALQFSKAKATTKEKVIKKVTKAPKRVVNKSEKTTDTKSSKVKALKRSALDDGGDVDTITELFLAAAAED